MKRLLIKAYARDIIQNLKSKKFSLNMVLRTKSKTVSEVLNILFNSDVIKLNSNADIEFYADIDESGENIILYKNKKQIDENQLWGIMVYLLKDYFNADKVLLPASVSEKIENFAVSLGLSVMYSGLSKQEQLEKMLEYSLYKQERLFSDGIYFAVSLLDYLNYNRKSLESLLDSIPNAYTKKEIINSSVGLDEILNLLTSTKSNSFPIENGVKIFKDNGWVLIVPEKLNKSITVITESTSFEGAEELCFDAINKIKTCKN